MLVSSQLNTDIPFSVAINSSTESHQLSSSHSDISVSGTLFTIINNELAAEGPLQSPVTIEVAIYD